MHKETLEKYLPKTTGYIENSGFTMKHQAQHYKVVYTITHNSKIFFSNSGPYTVSYLDDFIHGYLTGIDRLTHDE